MPTAAPMPSQPGVIYSTSPTAPANAPATQAAPMGMPS
jgi:hypothetical protein